MFLETLEGEEEEVRLDPFGPQFVKAPGTSPCLRLPVNGTRPFSCDPNVLYRFRPVPFTSFEHISFGESVPIPQSVPLPRPRRGLTRGLPRRQR